ncbi:hypothetical protein ACUY4R_003491 [Kosakonia sp. BK9b]
MFTQQFLQQRDFPAARDFKKVLVDGRQRIHGVDLNRLRITLYATTYSGNGFWPGGRKEQRLP